MCGIVGLLSAEGLDGADIALVRRINALQVHRGPDGAGEFQDKYAALAMRRLAIIDLNGGWQPLYNEDRSLTLVANGEIYNFVELRRDLERRGHRFATGSDCEVILHLYEEYQDECVQYLRGMFAFALWDMRRRRLLLARDRMGEKPLYFHLSDRRILFASELKALTLSGAVPMDLDATAINAFFHYQYVPEPSTPLRHVKKVPAGGLMTINVENWHVRESIYWDMDDAPPLDGNPATVIRDELERVSELIVRSDVPVGVALSGGLDSSVVAALATPRCRGQLQAFSVGYAGQQACDERPLAREFADHLGIPFFDIELSTQDVVRQFQELVCYRDEPIADISGTGYYAVMKLAREHKVPVVLQGHGGDELFWGYPWVRRCVEETNRKDAWLRGERIRSIYSDLSLPQSMRPRVLARWARESWHAHQHRCRLERTFSKFPDQFVFYDLTPDYQYASRHARGLYTAAFLEECAARSPEEVYKVPRPWKHVDVQLTRLICETYLRVNGIVQGDRLSMASAVELRLPLLDYRLVETVVGLRKRNADYALPPKTWLRDAVRGIVPDWVMQRPKRGFAPPVQEWHKALFQEYGSLLNDGFLVNAGIVRPENAKELSGGPFPAGTVTPLSFKALVLEIWFRSCISASPTSASSTHASSSRNTTVARHTRRREASLAPIAVFGFRRPRHLQRTLEALSRNPESAKSKLTIFCDGARDSSDEALVAEVRAIAKSSLWCGDVEVVERSANMGLANSIIDGVTRLCSEHGQVIVVEDDLEVAPTFLDYMNRALKRFAEDERVMQVSGYMFPITANVGRRPFLLPLTTSWGWATWQRAWQAFDPGSDDNAKLLNDPRKRLLFDLNNAYPYARMLESQQSGKIDSWAIRWYRTVFLRGGLVLYPPHSLVNNFGFDGSGTHCGTVTGCDRVLLAEPFDEFLPETSVDEAMLARVATHLAQTGTNGPAITPARRYRGVVDGVLSRLRGAH